MSQNSWKQGGSKDHWPKLPNTGKTHTSGQKKSGSVQNRQSQTKWGPITNQNQNQVRQNHQPHPSPPPPSSNRRWETQSQNQDTSQDMLRKMLARLDQQAEELKDLKNNSLQYQDRSRDRSQERSRSPRSPRHHRYPSRKGRGRGWIPEGAEVLPRVVLESSPWQPQERLLLHNDQKHLTVHIVITVNISTSNIDFFNIDPDWSIKTHDTSNILTVDPDQLTSIVETDFKIASHKTLI